MRRLSAGRRRLAAPWAHTPQGRGGVKHTPADPPPKSRGFLYLFLAVALSAVPLIVLSRAELIGYDAFWHVFVAQQDQWRNFWQEIRLNAHPPLFYLCLKAAIAALGANPIAYRLVPVVAILGSTWLVGRIVQRTAS